MHITVEQQEAYFLVSAVAVACAIPGAMLLLRRLSLVADAISHVLLFGIVVSFFVVRDLTSPWLLVGAAGSGLLTVFLVESITRSRRVKEDAAIGLVFPTLFSLGAILASLYFRETHLDVDQVLLGHVEWASRARPVYLGGAYLGRVPTLIMFGVGLMNLSLMVIFYKELKLTTFDSQLAAQMGFMPALVHYVFMADISITTVAAFDSVGPVLVLALLVLPAATAGLFTRRLAWLIPLSIGLTLVACAGGVAVAFRLRANLAGTVAATLGVGFALATLVSPQRGLIAEFWRRRRLQNELILTMLTVHLAHHEGTAAEAEEAAVGELYRHMHWPPHRLAAVVRQAKRAELVTELDGRLMLTPPGRVRAARQAF